MSDISYPPVDVAAIYAAMPAPSSSTPPPVADVGALGATTPYARADHTHATNNRKGRIQTATDGTVTVTFSPPFDVGIVPRCNALVETGVGVTDVLNAQVEGTPTNTQVKFRVNRTQQSVVALLGLTILSVPSSPGVQWLHWSAFPS